MMASLILAIFFFVPTFADPPEARKKEPRPKETSLHASFGKLPVHFIENSGQLDESVRYYIKGGDRTLFFTSKGVTFSLAEKRDETRRWTVRLDFVNAKPEVQLKGERPRKAVFNFFKGKQGDWKTKVPTFGRLVYHELWPGIDLVYSCNGGQLKYEFIVKPGADPERIRLRYQGASEVSLEASGALKVVTPVGCFEDGVPFAYQQVRGEQKSVPMKYALQDEAGDGSILYGFEVGPYRRDRPLILDPVLFIYCGYLGGGYVDSGLDIAVDGEGCAYLTGHTFSTDFPVKVGPDLVHNGNYDAYIAKVNAQGTDLVYCGFIGGFEFDMGYGVAVDAQGNAYVTGLTESGEAGFPAKVGPSLSFGGWEDAFVAKVNAQGTDLVYCGYIGGTARDSGYDIAVDQQGNAYITGYTGSKEAHFPVKVGPDLTFNGQGDGFVAKVNAQGTGLVYCGYIGGEFYDNAFGIAVDAGNHAYVAGHTNSYESTFPVKVGPDLTFNGGNSDAFIAKVSAQGTDLVYCGFIGGADIDSGNDAAVDGQGNAYVGGGTWSDESSFPVKVGPDLIHNGDSDAFVAKVNAQGTDLDYCGFIGGSDSDLAREIALGKWNNVYVAGHTESNESSFPVEHGPDLTHNGGKEAFVARVDAQGRRLDYCGYIGGDSSDYGYGIAVDGQENAYVTGEAYSDENSFPVEKGPDLTHNGGSDAFVARVSMALVADPLTLSEAAGGTVLFFLNAGMDNAGRDYLLLGGASGTNPGVLLPGGQAVLPLNWDIFTNVILSLVNTSLFEDFMGTLDGEGSACAQMCLPPVPGAAGTVMYFAYALNKPFDFASNPVEIAIVP